MPITSKNISSKQKKSYDTNVEDIVEYKSRMKKVRNKKENFGSQNIDMNQYIISPQGFEGVMLSLYFLFIPYVTGLLFLFVFIAHVTFEKFFLLDFSSIFIVWMIGYEVLAVLILTLIFFSYFKYLLNSASKN